MPYGGGSPATIAVLRGEVQMLLAGSLAVLPLIQSGGLKPLGIAAETRAAALPDVPTFREQGIDYSPAPGSACWRRRKRRPAIIALLNREVARRAAQRRGARPHRRTGRRRGGRHARRISRNSCSEETERLAAVIRRANIQLD